MDARTIKHAPALMLVALIGAGIGGCRITQPSTSTKELSSTELMAPQACSEQLRLVLKTRLQENIDEDIKAGEQRMSGLAWNGSDYAEAALIGYQRFGDQRFIEMVVDYYDRVLARRDDKLHRFDNYHKRVMKAWGSRNLDQSRWIAHITHNARILHTGILLAKLTAQDRRLEAFNSKADHYLKEAESTLQEFDQDWQPVPEEKNLSWYRRPNDKGYEATNHIHMIGRTWINLAAMTGNPLYQRRISMVLAAFLKGLRRHPDQTVSWNYFPYFAHKEKSDNTRPNGQDFSEPIWKAVLTTPFLLEAHANGYAVPKWLIKSIGRSFAEISLQDNSLLRNLSDPNSRAVDTKNDASKLEMVTHALGLTAYSTIDSRITPKLNRLVHTRSDLFPGGWLASAPGIRGYAIAGCPVLVNETNKRPDQIQQQTSP